MPPPIEFREDEKRQLVVDYAPDADVPVTDGAALTALAAAAGYGGWLLDAAAVDAAAQCIAAGTGLSAILGRCTDAEYRVDIAADKMAASLTIVAAHGGNEADGADAMAALSAGGVVFGIDEAALAAVLAAPGTTVEVARGLRPQAAVDARLEALVDVNQTRHPREDDKGHVDFRELGLVRSVNAGMPLMRRHPPQPGVPGHTVAGSEIPAAKPKDIKFPVRLQGVQASADDPDLLVAAVDGQPVLHRDGISVEPLLVLQEVNLASGNVDFVGTVEVKGDVQSGMKIKAGGDVIVHGILESAEVEAGGDVVVHRGIIGQKMHMLSGKGDAQKSGGTRIHACANVRAHHVENAVILAEQSVYIDEAAVQSDITAIDQVVVGKEGGRKGHILGGIVRATQGVTAECLGGPGTGETRVMIGINPLLQKALDAMKAAIAAKTKERDDLEKVIKILQDRPDRREMFEKARLTLERTDEELAEVMADVKTLEGDLKQAQTAAVVVKRNVFPGVSVSIGRKLKIVTEQHGPGTFRLAIETINGKEDEVIAYQ